MKDLKLKSVHLLAVLFAAGVAFIFIAANKPIGDFGNYYYGSKIAAEHPAGATAVYDPFTFNMETERAGEKDFFLNYNPVPPQSLLLYRPFTFFASAHTAKLFFNVSGLLFLLFALSRYLRTKGETVNMATVVIFIAALIPMYYNILFGQTYLFIAGLLMLSMMQMEKRAWLSGTLLGIAIALKLSPVILLLLLISEKRFKVIAWTLVCGVVISVGTIFFFDVAAEGLNYIIATMPKLALGYISDPYSSSFQGLIVFLRKLMVPDAILNPDPLISGSEPLAWFIAVAGFIILSWFLVGSWKKNMDIYRKVVLLLLLSAITSGYSSTYSFFVLAPFIAAGNEKRDWLRVMLYAAVFMFPPRILDGLSPFLEEYKLWMLIAIFILEIKPSFGFKRIEKPQLIIGVMLLLMSIGKFMQRPEQLPFVYYRPDLVKQDFILRAEYADSTITYISNIPQGFGQFSVPYNGSKPDICESCPESFYLRDVSYHEVGQHGDSLLILSDYHRGPGLYHLYSVSKRDLIRISGEELGPEQ